MQLDLGGMLASLLTELLPDAPASAAGGKSLPVDGFRQILAQLNTALETHGIGQLPLDTQSQSQQLPFQSQPVEIRPSQSSGPPDDSMPRLADELQAMIAKVRVLAQRRESGMVVAGDTVIVKDADPGELLAALEQMLPDFTLAVAMEDIPLAVREEAGTGAKPQKTGMAMAEIPDVADGASGSENPAPTSPHPVAVPESPLVAALPEAAVESVTSSDGPVNPPPATLSMETAVSGAEDTAGFQPAAKPEQSAADAANLPSQVPDRPAEPDQAGSGRGEEPARLEPPRHLQPPPNESQPRSSATVTVTRPFDHPQWSDELGERLIWLRDQSVQTAELRIHPQHLGPVTARIQVHEDQTSIQFASQHAVVREALEAALPRLRELFAGQQLQLVQVDVGQQLPGDQNGSQPRDSDSRNPWQSFRHDGDTERGELPEAEEPRRSPGTGNRLLNLYV
ncbi:MAG TPA: hypothetical protein ENI90_03950 [Methylothermaceae bacterium]|nr:hypothetical protein [Methylothermaceae bacterium]